MTVARSEGVEEATAVTFVCDDCGRVHNTNTPPCNDCGSMTLVAEEGVVDETMQIDQRESWDLVRGADQQLTGVGAFVYVVALGTLVLGGYGLANGNLPFGLPVVGAGLLAMPVLRRRAERRLSTHLSPLVVLVAYLVLCVGGFVLGAML